MENFWTTIIATYPHLVPTVASWAMSLVLVLAILWAAVYVISRIGSKEEVAYEEEQYLDILFPELVRVFQGMTRILDEIVLTVGQLSQDTRTERKWILIGLMAGQINDLFPKLSSEGQDLFVTCVAEYCLTNDIDWIKNQLINSQQDELITTPILEVLDLYFNPEIIDGDEES